MKHYILEITEINGEYEYPARVLFNAEDDDSAHDIAEEITLDFRGSAEWEDGEGSTLAWNDDGRTAIRWGGFHEVSESDYEVLKKYLAVL